MQNVGHHFVKSNNVWRNFPGFSRSLSRFSGILPGSSGILPRFLGILPRFSGIVHGFSTNQNFWGCICTSCTPDSYTTDQLLLYFTNNKVNLILTFASDPCSISQGYSNNTEMVKNWGILVYVVQHSRFEHSCQQYAWVLNIPLS